LPPPKAILFDLDDTLLDRARTFEKYFDAFASRYGERMNACDPATLRRCILDADGVGYRPRPEMAQYLIDRLPWRDQPSVEDLVASYRADFLACAHLSEGSHELLDHLRERSIKTGVITNGETEVQRRKIERLGLTNRMDTIVISQEFGSKKPDPAIFRFALDRLGTKAEETWFIGDHPDFDVLGAQAVGMKAFWIARMTPWPADNPMCERRIESLNELLALLDKR
jgi:putative hydrolase of the HAD superfamily